MDKSKNILTYKQAERVAAALRRSGKKIVFVAGAYDIPHAGHAYYFKQARKRGDVLFVSVGSDRTIKILKGRSRPVLKGILRVQGVAAFKAVDYAVLDNERLVMPGKINFLRLIKAINPHIFAVNDSDSALIEKHALCKKLGIQFALINVKRGPNISTTKIISAVLKKSKLS